MPVKFKAGDVVCHKDGLQHMTVRDPEAGYLFRVCDPTPSKRLVFCIWSSFGSIEEAYLAEEDLVFPTSSADRLSRRLAGMNQDSLKVMADLFTQANDMFEQSIKSEEAKVRKN